MNKVKYYLSSAGYSPWDHVKYRWKEMFPSKDVKKAQAKKDLSWLLMKLDIKVKF